MAATPTPRPPTMADVAAAAGVSVMTVSYTYSRPERVAPATRDRVRESAAELGYRGPDPTGRLLRRGTSNNLAVVVGEGLPYAFDDPESRRFLGGVASVCVEYGQNLVLIPINGDDGDVQRIREAVVDGFIFWTGVSDGSVLDAIVGTGKPVAIQGVEPDSIAGIRSRREAHAGRISVVTIDDRAAARAIARVAMEGRRQPSIVSFSLARDDHPRIECGPAIEDALYPGARERLRGFRDACVDLGIDWAQLPVAIVGRNDRIDAAAIVGELLARPEKTDAVVAMSDQLALAVVDAADVRGLHVPSDVAVSGWDDSPEAEEAGITSVHQSLRTQGAQCALYVLGRDGARDVLDWSLSIRDSTRHVI